MMTRTNRTTKTARIAILTASVLLLAAGSATAGDDDDDNPFSKQKTKVGFGMLVGSYGVGYIDGTGVGMHFELGRKSGPVYLYGEYDMLSVGESSIDIENPVRGFLHRGSANVRYNFAQVGGRRVPVQGEFWVEAGIGQQYVRWHKGGKLTRNDLSIGFGAKANFRLSKRHAKKPKTLGFHYAFKAFIARAPDGGSTEPTCAGPCDEPTPPSPNDLGLFFNVGLEFGK